MNSGPGTTLRVRSLTADRCCGDPGDCQEPCAGRTVCVCEPSLRAVEVFDGRCPAHGLAVTLQAFATTERGEL